MLNCVKLPFINDLKSLIIAVSGTLIGAGILFMYGKAKSLLYRRRFRHIFGKDALLGPNFHAVNTDFIPGFMFADRKVTLKLTDPNGDPIVPVYIKRPLMTTGEEPNTSVLTIENPISGGGARALNHIFALTHSNSKKPISISLDHDVYQRQDMKDISFISFGGPHSNYKTMDVLTNAANNLANFVEAGVHGRFIDLETEEEIARPQADFDYGLILKLHPKERSERTWLVCAGFGEWGTSGAAYFLANNWKEIYRDVKKYPFAIVVQVAPKDDQSAEPIWGKVSTPKGLKRLYEQPKVPMQTKE